ncbi:keratin-associated protein 13-1-like [Tamandua tetradactyla]|uniref:keratin-associated protein 13-1-like n=1 Tax=Tamandua tetradactyla TaxID=48850 RepID=UPI004053E726
MPFNCSSENFSLCSLGSSLCYPGSTGGSSYPSNLVYSTNICPPSVATYKVGSSLYNGCQKTCQEPSSCHTSYVVSSPCQTSSYHPRTSILCSPCPTTYTGCLGYGSRSFYSLGCGSRGFQPLGYDSYDFPSLGYRSGFCRPTYLASRSC